jgi:hypothetical protein
MMAVRVMGCEWRVRTGRSSQKVTGTVFWCREYLQRILRSSRALTFQNFCAEDEMDFARMCASPEMSALLNHTLEFYFECDDGRVCGAGAQPPLHMFGTPMSLQAQNLKSQLCSGSMQ